ncbi:MAG: sigma-70 family RNA polymerase sigma factor [Clostridiales bacterium]|nr:sigma-70 family RNA polymerase sigma factor [Clostridiales bacterium]
MKPDKYELLITYLIDHQDKFYRLAFSYVKKKDDALDVVQNAICKALEHHDALKNEDALKTWFYRILVNESLLFLKKQKEKLLPDADQELHIPYYEKGYDIHDDLYDQINQLDADLQTIIKLRYFEEMSLQEIADITETNLNTVKSKLYRSLKLLKQNLEEVAI